MVRTVFAYVFLYPPARNGELILLARFPKADGVVNRGAQRVLVNVLHIAKAVYHVRRMIPNDSLFNAQAQNLLNGATVKYPIDRVRVQFQTLAAGSSNFNLRLEHGKQLPNRVIVGLVREEALGGDYRYNPCAFKPYGLQTISLQQD